MKMDQSIIEAFERRFVSIDTGTEVNLDNPIGTLQALLEQITQRTAAVDLTSITETPSWWRRFTGAHLQSQIELEMETEVVSRLFHEAQAAASEVRARRRQYEDRRENLISAVPRLSSLDEWTTEQLLASKIYTTSESAWYRHRLETKQANLKTIIISAKMHLSQIDLVRRHIDFILDVHFELEQKLYPIWKQHVENLASNTPNSKITGEAATALSVLGGRLGAKVNAIGSRVGKGHE